MAVPQGFTIIKSVAFANRVVDLSKAQLNDPLIGFPQSNSANQKWKFEVIGDNQFTIKTTTEDGGIAFAHTSIEEGAVLVGRGFPGIFEPETFSGGQFRIFPKENKLLAWTLKDENEETNITLEPSEDSLNQLWFLLPVPS